MGAEDMMAESPRVAVANMVDPALSGAAHPAPRFTRTRPDCSAFVSAAVSPAWMALPLTSEREVLGPLNKLGAEPSEQSHLAA
jgi:hypothetical protein